MLNTNQTKWIYVKVNQFADKWIENLPCTDEDCDKIRLEADELYKKSHKNALCGQLLVGTLTYIESLVREPNTSHVA